MWYFTAVFTAAALAFSAVPVHAGLNLKNQTEVYIPDLDLDKDGRIQRAEMAKYMFYYFDRDGNESLTSGEMHADREFGVRPYEAAAVSFIDLDNDGADDGVVYDTRSFLMAVMADEYEPEDDDEGTIEASDFIDRSLLEADTDKSKAVELDEWLKAYDKHAAVRANRAPKAADQDGYSR